MCQILNSVIMTLASSAIGGAAGGAMGGWFAVRAASNSIREASRLAQETSLKSSITALKMEVQENLSALDSKELKDSISVINAANKEKSAIPSGTKVYVALSDITWNNCRSEVGCYDEFVQDISKSLCDAYIVVGRIKTIIIAAFTQGGTAYTSLPAAVNDAVRYLLVAKSKLDELREKYGKEKTR